MDRMRQWTILTILAVLVVLAGGYFLLVQPKKDKTAEVRAGVESQLVVNNRLQADINRLKKQAIDLPRQQAKLAALSARIPNNPALPTLIRTMTDAADRAGVELVSLAPTAPTLIVGGPAPGAVAGAPQTAAAPAGTEPLYGIQLAIVVNGGYVQVQQFFSNLEDLSRTMQVSAFAVAPLAGTDSAVTAAGVTASITSRVYMTAPTAVVPPPLTAGTPAPAASASAAPGAAATPSPTAPTTPAATPAQ
ncbi:MAG TPA: hypothetical protein VNA14_03620 [Mycobacteriales bacterium]|nr:hypothetical protein [Mycobacteriales bacterium]